MFRMPKTAAMLSLLVAASLLPQSANGQIAATSNQAVDVAVRFTASGSGQLVGKFMHHGQPAVRQPVRLRAKQGLSKSVETQAITDANGQFSFSIERGGVYFLEAAGRSKVCRIWHATQAPPAAVAQVLLASNCVVRGQACGCGNANCNGCEYSLGGFQNCDTCCGEPPVLSDCESCKDLFGGCDCGGCLKGRNKLLPVLLGAAIIGFALDDDDGPIEADFGTDEDDDDADDDDADDDDADDDDADDDDADDAGVFAAAGDTPSAS